MTGNLSPDEIKALLGQEDREAATSTTLSDVEREAFYELLTISIGGSCNTLSQLFSKEVEVKALEINMTTGGNLPDHYVVRGEFSGAVMGQQFLSISEKEYENLRNLVDPSDDEKIELEFSKVLQPILTSLAKTLATVSNKEVTHIISEMEGEQGLSMDPNTVETGFHLQIGQDKSFVFHSYLPISLVKKMVALVTDEDYSQEVEEMPYQSMDQDATDEKKQENTGTASKIQSVQFSNFTETEATGADPNNLNMLLDIPLQVTVELGRTKRMVKEVLEISQGSIIELDKLAGEPVDILVNNKLIAVGEVVVIDENFGVRVTEIVSKS